MVVKIQTALIFCLCLPAGFCAERGGCLIQSKQAGGVRAGMTVAQARLVLRGNVLKRAEDGDHLPILEVLRGEVRIMDLYWDIDEPRTERALIELIRVYDPACATADGVHAGMPLAEVEKHYGKFLRIERTETEGREYAEFAQVPSWIGIQVGDGDTGMYAKGNRCAYQYRSAAKVESLWVSHPRGAAKSALRDSCEVPMK